MSKLAGVLVVSACVIGVSSHATAATLYGVTGDQLTSQQPVNPEVLYNVSTADASTSFVQNLGNGDDGESIAFNPIDRLLYHWSGFNGGKIMETINIDNQSIANISVNVSSYDPSEVFGSTYHAASGDFLITDGNSNLARVSLSGDFSLIGATDLENRGLALVGSTLYAGAKDSSTLSELNPNTGGTLSTVPVTLSGFVRVEGILGLATDPDSGTLYGILKTEPGPNSRRLATIDPSNGIASDIDPLRTGLANIAFVPEPSTLLLAAMCAFAVLLVGMLRHRP